VTGTEVEATASQQLERVPDHALDRAARLGMWLAAAESKSNDPKALGMSAALRIAYAESLGLPAHAAQEVHLIRGNLTLSAKLCRALAHQHGLRVVKVDEKADSVTAAVVNADGNELGRTTYTLAMAKKQGLSGENWTKNPDRMLWARASKRALDDFAPWVTVGILSHEQVQDADLDPDEVLSGEVVGEDGEPFKDAD
jgi:hypothetical protein